MSNARNIANLPNGDDAPVYACRAWVNFDGTTNTAGFCTIRDSGNVASITDNGQGLYRISFTTNMPDVNYSCVATGGASGHRGNSVNITNMADDLIEFNDGIDAGYYDSTYVCIAVFR